MNIKEGYIIDYISGEQVKATLEETEAVQIFCKQLVEDYKYPKDCIQTHPQYRVKVRPSDTRKEYPVDIAVFNSVEKNEDNIHIIVECKKHNRKDGKTQLQDYLRFSKATLGVWYNGADRLFLRKYEHNGKIDFKEIPNIPLFNQRIEDIGQFKRKDLQPTHNLKATFRSIRNFLAANNVGTTRDEVLAGQLINLIFCKIYDEKYTSAEDIVRFRVGIDEPESQVVSRIHNLFNEVKTKMNDVIDEGDKIELDSTSLVFVVGELQNYSLMDCQRDVIADAFETFIGHSLKGAQGQFFTPRNVVKMIVDILQPTENDKIIDPACGSGGFLIETLKHIWDKTEKDYKNKDWKENQIENEKGKIATKCIRGIDKDYFLSKVAKAYMNLIGDGTSGIFCEDSLENPTNWKQETQVKVQLNSFDIVITNPPFGDKIKVEGIEGKLKQYDLAKKWKKDKKTNQWTHNNTPEKRPPQILFIERCLQLLKDGGRMGIVLPEGTFGNSSDRYIWEYITKYTTIEAIISVPTETFQPSTPFKTSILVLKKEKATSDYPIFMAVARSCGHNKNGKDVFIMDKNGEYIIDENGEKIVDDEIKFIANKYLKYSLNNFIEQNHLGFYTNYSKINNWIFIPDYYDAELKNEINKIDSKQYELISIQELIDNKTIQIKRGNEIGSEHYGKGNVPFIRTSDIVNWELKIDPQKCVSFEIYNKFSKRQDIQPNDILLVKEGDALMGNTAIINETDLPILIQSHLHKIRVLKNDVINPYYLLYLLNTNVVKKQMKQYTFIQGTIPTIGDRLMEIVLPIHKDSNTIKAISDDVKNIIEQKRILKQKMDNLIKNSI